MNGHYVDAQNQVHIVPEGTVFTLCGRPTFGLRYVGVPIGPVCAECQAINARADQPQPVAPKAPSGIPARGSPRPEDRQGDAVSISTHGVDEARLRYPAPKAEQTADASMLLIRSRLLAISKGNWQIDPERQYAAPEVIAVKTTHLLKRRVAMCLLDVGSEGITEARANAEFIAHAPEDESFLLATIDAQAAEIAALRSQVETLDGETWDATVNVSPDGTPNIRVIESQRLQDVALGYADVQWTLTARYDITKLHPSLIRGDEFTKHAPPAPPAKASVRLTKAQIEIAERLTEGWTIAAVHEDWMTEWVRPSGNSTGYACSISSLKAMKKKGFISFNVSEWSLTDAGRSALQAALSAHGKAKGVGK